MTEDNEPVQPAQTQAPTQSTEDAIRRLTGVPKTAEELEAEREAVDEERRTRFAQSAQPSSGRSPNENQEPSQPGPTPPEPEPQPAPEPEPTPEPAPEPTP